MNWNGIGLLTIGRQQQRGNKERLEFLKNTPVKVGGCQMNMTDATLIAMRREIRVDQVYLSTTKQFEIKFSIGSRHTGKISR